MTEALAATCPTVIVYVMDTVRSVSPITFMSNMLYACSILYKTRLPFIVVMNKVCKEIIHVVKYEIKMKVMQNNLVFISMYLSEIRVYLKTYKS